MINTLYLPELREMLANADELELREFCIALNPSRTAEFMEGLSADEMWRVLQYADHSLRVQIFGYFEWDRQLELLATQDEVQVASLVTHLSADDAVDLMQKLPVSRVDAILALVPAADRRDIRRLQTFKEGTAGALMTTEAACLGEQLTVRQALEQLSRQAERLETIYYIYVTDDTNHLRGVVSTRKLVSSIGRLDTKLVDLMISDVVAVHVNDDQENVAQIVAHYNLLAIPVVDDQRHMLGIITHDDVIDVVREEATEDLHRIAAVTPLTESYMRTAVSTLSWKRGIWLIVLFFAGLLTAFALRHYELELKQFDWLVWFIPLIIGSGGNSGSQSSTLIIMALATNDVTPKDWWQIVRREAMMGLILGSGLSVIGLVSALLIAPTYYSAMVIPITILMVVLCGTITGSLLPVIFRKLGLDPAMMSNPFVAGINDITGIVIYINVARLLLT